jgi:hypothetical protein
MPYEPSKYAGSAPIGAASLQTRAQLRTALDSALSNYKLAKRFLAQCSATVPSPAPKTTPPVSSGSKMSNSKSPPTEAPRFTRNGNVANPQNALLPAHKSHSSNSSGRVSPRDFSALEELQTQQQLRTAALFGSIATSTSVNNLPELLRSASAGSASGPRATTGAPHRDVKHSKEAKYGGNTDPDEDSDNEDADCYREYYAEEQIAELLPEEHTVQLLQNILRTYYNTAPASPSAPGSESRNKAARSPRTPSTGSVSNESVYCSEQAQQVSAFGVEREALIANAVYLHWRYKRSQCSTSLLRAYHRFIMDLWSRADSVVVPMPSDYLHRSLLDSRAELLQVRRALDRARLITDRVRRRERLKRDIVRASSEHFDVLQEDLHWSIAAKQPAAHVKKEPTPPTRTKTPSPPKGPELEFGGALHYITQGRDNTGKFLSNRQTGRSSSAQSKAGKSKVSKGTSSAVATPATMGGLAGSARSGKTLKHQAIPFSIPPASDEESEGTSVISYLWLELFVTCLYGCIGTIQQRTPLRMQNSTPSAALVTARKVPLRPGTDLRRDATIRGHPHPGRVLARPCPSLDPSLQRRTGGPIVGRPAHLPRKVKERIKTKSSRLTTHWKGRRGRRRALAARTRHRGSPSHTAVVARATGRAQETFPQG